MSGELLQVGSALLRKFPLPDHTEDEDKHERGLALIIAGSRELAGAAILAGTGALRAGAGRLRIATSESIAAGLGPAIPEARVISFPDGADGCIAAGAVGELVERCRVVDSLTIGPGMREGEALATLMETVLDSRAGYPLIVDAAALAALPPLADRLRDWQGGAVLLPNAGEMAKLLGWSKDRIADNPLDAAAQAAARFGAVAVIKGKCSFIVAPDGRRFGFLGGGVGLATSGSGDALAGIVGGLAARGADPLTAALWGVYLHGEAGRRLTREVGRIGFLAREILDLVPQLMDMPDRET